VGGATPAPPPFFCWHEAHEGLSEDVSREEHEECIDLMYCIPPICLDNFSFSMMTGVFIERLFPSTTICPSTCLLQPTYAQATVGKQFLQQQYHQL
jgi:hypothetical protein